MKRMEPPLRIGFVGRPRATSEKRSPINPTRPRSELRSRCNRVALLNDHRVCSALGVARQSGDGSGLYH
jgi:hypothetical protein